MRRLLLSILVIFCTTNGQNFSITLSSGQEFIGLSINGIQGDTVLIKQPNNYNLNFITIDKISSISKIETIYENDQSSFGSKFLRLTGSVISGISGGFIGVAILGQVEEGYDAIPYEISGLILGTSLGVYIFNKIFHSKAKAKNDGENEEISNPNITKKRPYSILGTMSGACVGLPSGIIISKKLNQMGITDDDIPPYTILFSPIIGSVVGYYYSSRFVRIKKSYDLSNLNKEQKLIIIKRELNVAG